MNKDAQGSFLGGFSVDWLVLTVNLYLLCVGV